VWWFTPVIPATQDAETGRIKICSQPWQKVSETPVSNNKLRVVAHACHPSYTGALEGIKRRIIVQAGPGKNMRPYPENN
jgi:hypothetical protein